MKEKKQSILIILDGWGISNNSEFSAIDQAQTPYFDSLIKKYPNAKLLTHGENVGLPSGQMGNSEVGHINIGAGRIVYQELAKINRDIVDKTIDQNKKLIEAFNYCKSNKKKLHFIGLVSDGGVHSHINHIKHLINLSKTHELKNVFIHAFTDGRDVDPKSGINMINELVESMDGTNVKLASVCGRYYAMDRDKRWERTKKAYDLIVNGIGKKSNEIEKSIIDSYNNQITDEFIEPIVVVDNKNLPLAKIEDNDVVIFFNFRTDRGRQLTEVLSQKDFNDFSMKKLNLKFLTMTNYNDDYKNIDCIYENENLTQTLGEVLEQNLRTQIRIAETEKYPHVTFFFNGGKESPFKDEIRIMCPSPKVATYDLKPEMSAFEIRDAIIPEINSNSSDFICLNFANPDMVGHTGNFNAAVKACETVDTCLREIVESSINKNYSIIIIADHGNSDVMKNNDGSPNTAHTTNPVPIIVIDSKTDKVNDGILADIAPTILNIMDIDIPEKMSGKILI